MFPQLWIAGEPVGLYALHMQLSYSRYDVVVWSERKDQLAWHHGSPSALSRFTRP